MQHGGTPTGKYVIYSGDLLEQEAGHRGGGQAEEELPRRDRAPRDAAGQRLGWRRQRRRRGGGGGGGSGGGGGTNSGTSAASSLKGKSGNAYVKASAKLPSTVGTGNGPPPKKDNKKAGGGTSATCIGC